MTFEENLQRLIGNWPTLTSRADRVRRELHTLWKEVGHERFTKATDAIIATGNYKFFPTVAEFRGYIPQAKRKPFCGQCESGWIRVPDYAARRLYQNTTATEMLRCECRRGEGFEKYEKRVVAWRLPE